MNIQQECFDNKSKSNNIGGITLMEGKDNVG